MLKEQNKCFECRCGNLIVILEEVLHDLAHKHRVLLFDANMTDKCKQIFVDSFFILVLDDVLDNFFKVFFLWIQSYCFQETSVNL